jgi:hypothetical protein
MNHHLKRLREEIESAIVGLSAEEWSWHPPGKWCAAEVLEHLYLTYTGTLRGFAKVAEAGKPMATQSTWTHRGRTLIVLGFGYFPRGRESPPVARPRGVPPEKVIAEIGPKITAMDEIVSSCEKTFGSRTNLLDHPILGPLTGSQWKKFHLVHGLHHVKQIRLLRENSRGTREQLTH